MDVSILICSDKTEPLLDQTLSALQTQKTKLSYEIVLLDCSPGAQGLEVAKQFKTRVFTAPASLYSYACAVNAGVQFCAGTLLVALSPQAVPFDELWLEKLVAPLRSRQTLMATFSRQIAWENESSLFSEVLAREFDATGWLRDKANFMQMLEANQEPFSLLQLSLTSACIRRDFLMTHPLYELVDCEDRGLALDILSASTSFAYVPESVCLYSQSVHASPQAQWSKSAALSRHCLNVETARRFPKVKPEQFLPTKSALLTDLLYQLFITPLKVAEALLLPGNRLRLPEARYYLSIPGQIWGALAALKAITADGAAALKRANPSELVLQARLSHTPS